MKKLLFLFCIFLSFSLSANAQLVVKKLGNENILPNQIVVPITITSTNGLNLKIKALNFYISKNEVYKIPISQLYLDDGVNSYQLSYNNEIKFEQNNRKANYNLRIIDVPSLASGNYSTTIEFSNNRDREIFNLNFNVPVEQKLSSNNKVVKITVPNDKLLSKEVVVNSDVTPQLFIKSNSKWKLYLDNSLFIRPTEDYFLEILSVSENVESFTKQVINLNDNSKLLLAKGKETFSEPVTGTSINDYLVLRYSMRNKNGQIISAGLVNYPVNFILEEEI